MGAQTNTDPNLNPILEPAPNPDFELAKEAWRTHEIERSDAFKGADYGMMALRTATFMNAGAFAGIIAFASNNSDTIAEHGGLLLFILLVNGIGLFLATVASGSAYMSQMFNYKACLGAQKSAVAPYVRFPDEARRRRFLGRGSFFQLAAIALISLAYLGFIISIFPIVRLVTRL
ncbi:hypothetical protein [Breoghania sp. L-A4]|uniref:hypothetical protein n=1 Tax=Breoghania sp. L-A4 TaxID=2304600 RepID=UPI000E35A915|nr:hypothetical protein [Breoghania sp. L-A4]AXS41093.1 hypothetical protein D1F64_15015 [Breoghania sp. L-A4]